MNAPLFHGRPGVWFRDCRFAFPAFLIVLLFAVVQTSCTGLNGQLATDPSKLSFGSVATGSANTLSATLENSSGSNVTIFNVSISGPGFNANGVSTGSILNPGQAATLKVTFAPAASGTVTGSVIVTSDASNSPTIISLSGSGVQPASHSVTLEWSPSTSPTVIGYNVYRGMVSGGPYAKINSSVNTMTTYVDGSVRAGTTYYYVVTSVDTSNIESAFSQQESASVPTP
jgi:hypothetical protein